MSKIDTIVVAIADFLKSALAVWQTFISTRQEAYERKRDKQIGQALNIAEQSYDVMGEILDLIYNETNLPDRVFKQYIKLKKKLYGLKKKFDLLD